MKLVVLKENFLRAASLVIQTINLRPSLPVLSNFLLQTRTGMLEITGTNLETTITHTIPVKVQNQGEITIPARTLLDFCQGNPAEQHTFKMEKGELVVSGGEAVAKIPTIDPKEFPTTGKFVAQNTLSISKPEFLKAVVQTAFCAAPEEGRPVLTGTLLVSEGEKVSFVATDGYRLAKKEQRSNENLRALIPARALRECAKAVGDQKEDEVKISVNKDNNQVKIGMKNLSVFSRLLDGEYPNYEQIIPDSFASEVVVKTKDLIDSIKLASLFARDVGNVVRLHFEEKSIMVRASAAQVGEAETSVPAKTSGDKLALAFNSRFLLEPLAAIDSRDTKLSLSGRTSAVLIQGLEEKDLIYIVMPVRTQS
jgi:DNA polymerase-3 subunit beta